MKKCDNCNVNIFDSTKICPLCQSIISNSIDDNNNIYPIISHIHKNNIAINVCLIISILVGTLCIFLNLFVSDIHFLWSFICIAGIIYSWITVLYSIQKNVNIASHVMLQTVCISSLAIIIDHITGYRGWSLNLALPITLIVANVTLFILLLSTSKKYFRYIIYQLIVFVFSMLPPLFYSFHLCSGNILISISTLIAILTLIFTFIISGRIIKPEIERRFHF